jgi:hypothetical protein
LTVEDIEQNERDSIQLTLTALFGFDRGSELVDELVDNIDYGNAAQGIAEANAFQFVKTLAIKESR